MPFVLGLGGTVILHDNGFFLPLYLETPLEKPLLLRLRVARYSPLFPPFILSSSLSFLVSIFSFITKRGLKVNIISSLISNGELVLLGNDRC